jgi:hypothetical protein
MTEQIRGMEMARGERGYVAAGLLACDRRTVFKI